MILAIIILSCVGVLGWALFFIEKRFSAKFELAASDAIACAQELERLAQRFRGASRRHLAGLVLLWACCLWLLMRQRGED